MINVSVSSGDDGDHSQIVVTVEYLVIETQSKQLTLIQVN